MWNIFSCFRKNLLDKCLKVWYTVGVNREEIHNMFSELLFEMAGAIKELEYRYLEEWANEASSPQGDDREGDGTPRSDRG